MNNADRLALGLLLHGIPLDDDGYRQIGGCTAVGQAALLLAADESAIEAWYEDTSGEKASISRVLARAVDREDVAERVDATLADEPTVLEDLVRAQVAWSHEAMAGLLDRDLFRMAAAWMLAQTEPSVVDEWLDDERPGAAVVDAVRAIAPSGVEELFENSAAWFEPISGEDPELAARLEGALFVLSPSRWGRGYLGGRFDGLFLGSAAAMADVIGHTTDSYWTRALAAFADQDDEFELVARLAAAGVAACVTASPEDLEAIAAAFDEEAWEVLAGHPVFSVAVALADEEDSHPLVESAAHDLLVYRGYQSPGIVGLPLSASVPGDEGAEAAEALLAAADTEDPVRIVATVVDLAEVLATGRYEPLRDALKPAQRHHSQAVVSAATAARAPAMVQSLPDDPLQRLAAVRLFAARGDEDSTRTLIELWADGPPLLSGFVSDYVHYSMALLEHSS